MKQILSLFFLLSFFGSVFALENPVNPPVDFHSLSFISINGDKVDFKSFKGKKVLIVNTASKCGYTPQFEDLEKLHQQYKENLVVIGFPSNDFGGQDPGTNNEIQEFCKANYGVSFFMMEKSSVKNTTNNPVYQWLTRKSKNGWNEKSPNWNFCKYLIDEKGRLLAFFPSAVKPFDRKITSRLTQIRSSNDALDCKLPVRGLSVAAPSSENLNQFMKFIEEELVPAHFNLLILRIDYNYAYETHPELREKTVLSNAEVKQLVDLCRKYNIQIAPQINLLGHQSWASQIGKLLEVYPEFDETPHVKLPEKYEWPNPDGLYCKSYCPLHPDVHKIVFELVDELMDAFETNLFHAGMDEVFYIGDDKCPRCKGRDKAELYAGEVNLIQNHLSKRGGRLMIWGDRLIDGKTTGIGMWEASMNQTYRAIDLISKDVFICDWHYERADLTSVYFAVKGFDVATCPWKNTELAKTQLHNMIDFRIQSQPETAKHFKGIIQTIWTGMDNFLKEYYSPETDKNKETASACLKKMISEFKAL